MKTSLYVVLAVGAMTSFGCRSHSDSETRSGGSNSLITDFRLEFRGVRKMPRPAPNTASSFATEPFVFTVKDSRPRPELLGHFKGGNEVRTRENVSGFIGTYVNEMLMSAGANTRGGGKATVEYELLEWTVEEAGRYEGLIRVKVNVTRDGAAPWAAIYEGRSKSHGRNRSPDPFNEALSLTLEDVTRRIIQDDAFAAVLRGLPPPKGFPSGAVNM